MKRRTRMLLTSSTLAAGVVLIPASSAWANHGYLRGLERNLASSPKARHPMS